MIHQGANASAPPYALFAFLFILAITLLRIAYLMLNPHDLFFDEAQYWGWSQAMDWGFYSKPPAVAAVIYATTSLCGDTESCIRLGSPLLHAMTAGVIYATAYRLTLQPRIAFWSAITYSTLPAVSLSSTLISTDPVLLLCWSASLYMFICASQTGKLRFWILTGICAGLGMMSKYNMLIFAITALGYLVHNKAMHHHLKATGFWLAGAITLCVFLPNILWNADHSFVSFLHTEDNASIEGLTLHPDHMLEFFGAQFGVMGPILFSCLLVWLYHNVLKRRVTFLHANLLAWSILPMLGVILMVSLLSRAHANWAAPAYIGATLAVVIYLIHEKREHWLKISVVLHIVLMLGMYHMPTLVNASGFELSGRTTSFAERKIKDPFERVKGWQILGDEVQARLQAYPKSNLLTLTRKTHAELLYYVGRDFPSTPIIKWNPEQDIDDHYELTTTMDGREGQSFLFITQYEQPAMAAYFETVTPLKSIEIALYPDRVRHYYVVYLEGFKGYDAIH